MVQPPDLKVARDQSVSIKRPRREQLCPKHLGQTLATPNIPNASANLEHSIQSIAAGCRFLIEVAQCKFVEVEQVLRRFFIEDQHPIPIRLAHPTLPYSIRSALRSDPFRSIFRGA